MASESTPLLSHVGQCDASDKVQCGHCGLQWCEHHDPAPSAMCHACHGRGYTTAPWYADIDRPDEFRIEIEEVVRRTYTVRATSASFAADQVDGLEDDEYDTRVVDSRSVVAWRKEELNG